MSTISTIEDFFKTAPGVITMLSTVVGCLVYLIRRVIEVLSTDKISQLFLNNTQKIKIKIWNFISGLLFIFILFSVTGSYFSPEFHDIDIQIPGTAQKVVLWSAGIYFVSLVIIYLSPLFAHKIKYLKIIILTLILFNLLLALTFYAYAYNLLKTGITSGNITAIIVIPIVTYVVYFFAVYTINSTKKYRYIINRVIDDTEIILKLEHGFVIDEKRTICFPKDHTNKDTFYLCDFSSKIYLEYTKEIENQANKNPASKDSASKDSASKDSASKDPASKDPASKNPASKDSASKDPASKNPASKNPASKNPASKNPASKNPASKNPASKNPANTSQKK
ncbi:hypothetical protein [Bacillus mycoides]|uniref:hypothetical protein n=1 Tax=Bacillus mycoides TaxID=1405 RepID=UPI00114DDEA4|nr:hypothetical protein [Bacillus mycoides]